MSFSRPQFSQQAITSISLFEYPLQELTVCLANGSTKPFSQYCQLRLTVILSFNPATGGCPLEWLEESGYKKSEIEIKAAYIADYGGSNRQYFVIHSSEMNFEWILFLVNYITQYCYLNFSLNTG